MLLVAIAGSCECPVAVPIGGIELNRMLKAWSGEVVFVFAKKSHTEGGKCARIFRVDLRHLLQNGLRLFRLAAPQENNSLQVEDVRVVGCEFPRFGNIFLGLIELVLIECLESLVEEFFSFRRKNGTACISERFRR